MLHFLFPWTESGVKTLNGYYVTSARGGRSNQERHQRGASAVLLILCAFQMQASIDAQKSQSEYRSPLETPASTDSFFNQTFPRRGISGRNQKLFGSV